MLSVRKQTITEFVSKLYIFNLFYFPSFFGYININMGQMIYLGFNLLFSLFILFFFKKTHSAKFPLIIFLCCLLLCGHYFLSTTLNIKDNEVGFRDFIDCLRPIIYFFTFFSSLVVFKENRDSVVKLWKFAEKCVLFFALFEFLKFFYPLNFIFKLYTPFGYGHPNYIRFFGTTGYSYNYAWLLILFLVVDIWMNNENVNWKFMFYSMLIFLCGSRTGILAFAVCCLFLFIIFPVIRKRIILLGLIVILGIGIAYFLEVPAVKTIIDYIIQLVEALKGRASDGSLYTRRKQLDYGLSLFNTSPIWGTGTRKSLGITIENFYIHHLACWGAVGLFFYFILLFSFFFSLKTSKIRSVYFTVLIPSYFVAISTPLFDQIRVFNIFYFFISYIMCISRYNLQFSNEKYSSFHLRSKLNYVLRYSCNV